MTRRQIDRLIENSRCPPCAAEGDAGRAGTLASTMTPGGKAVKTCSLCGAVYVRRPIRDCCEECGSTLETWRWAAEDERAFREACAHAALVAGEDVDVEEELDEQLEVELEDGAADPGAEPAGGDAATTKESA